MVPIRRFRVGPAGVGQGHSAREPGNLGPEQRWLSVSAIQSAASPIWGRTRHGNDAAKERDLKMPKAYSANNSRA